MKFDENLLSVANVLADKAGELSRRYFRQRFALSFKAGLSPVTEVDLAIESALRDYLSKECPSHSILGEEYDLRRGASEYMWVIDPIDGTTSFACGKPTFCTLIALLYKGVPVIGIIDQPILKERFCGVYGRVSTLNDISCLTMALRPSDEAIVRLSCTTPLMFNAAQQRKFERVAAMASIISYGGDGYAYGLLAAGFIDAIVEADLNFYDVAALMPIVEGAGGVISDWRGRKITSNHFDGSVIAAHNKELHKRILFSLTSS